MSQQKVLPRSSSSRFKLKELKAEGLTILLVEQNFNFATGLADEITLLGRGQCVWRGRPEALAEDTETHERWLGV